MDYTINLLINTAVKLQLYLNLIKINWETNKERRPIVVIDST